MAKRSGDGNGGQPLASLPPLTLDWRSGCYSDWECILGDRIFKLHKIILANGSRGSRFFGAAFSESYEASSTDLTKLLPTACHEHMETVLDFVYGNNIVLDVGNSNAVWKIADVIQIDSLLQIARVSIQGHCGHVCKDLLKSALELQLPYEILENLARKVPASDLLSVLAAVQAGPEWGRMMELCSDLVKKGEERKLFTRSTEFTESPNLLRIKFKCAETIQLRSTDPNGVSSCRVRLVKIEGSGPSIGVAREKVDLKYEGCPDGGFATKMQAWGLCVTSGNLWSSGVKSGSAGKTASSFIGKVVTMSLDVPGGALRFVLEEGQIELGTITSSFADGGPLLFTVCSCCAGTEYEILP